MTDPEKVEIKVSLDSLAVERARAVFGLTDDTASPGSVWFCERLEDDDLGTELRMLDRNLIVRLRGRGDRSDCTVKFRRDEPFTLPAGWDADQEHGFKFEGDWSGDRHAWSASVSRRIDPSLLTFWPTMSSQFVSSVQGDFASAMTGVPAKLPSLTVLHPIHALAWDEVHVDFDDKVRAEQWSVDDRRFLEFSIRVDADRAGHWQKRFTALIRDKGFAVPAKADTKTAATLRYLATRSAPG
jgi:hypothetical protein